MLRGQIMLSRSKNQRTPTGSTNLSFLLNHFGHLYVCVVLGGRLDLWKALFTVETP